MKCHYRVSMCGVIACSMIGWLVPLMAWAAGPGAAVKLGIDVVREDEFRELAGKRIGLVVNPASVDSRLVATVDVLHGAKDKGVNLVALFGPEHGIYGDEYAGDTVADKVDPRTGLTVFSLYGKTRKPTPAMLGKIDALVFDLQDIGSRSYTYLSTLRDCLDACAAADKEFIVLDRPNPLGGQRIEGGLVEKGFESFVSYVNVPYVHGMTFGELAQMIRDRDCPDYKKLTVIRMKGWKREMSWGDTGLAWVPTSPHIPHAEAVAGYAATGIVGELYVLSNGVGYTLPFEIVGAPWVSGDTLADALDHHWSDPGHYYLSKAATRPAATTQFVFPMRASGDEVPGGIYFRSVRFRPFYATFKDTACQGVQVHVDPHAAETLVEINFRILQALDAPDLFGKNPKRFRMFDQVTGSSKMRERLMKGQDLHPLFDEWKKQCDEFRKTRKAWLLY